MLMLLRHFDAAAAFFDFFLFLMLIASFFFFFAMMPSSLPCRSSFIRRYAAAATRRLFRHLAGSGGVVAHHTATMLPLAMRCHAAMFTCCHADVYTLMMSCRATRFTLLYAAADAAAISYFHDADDIDAAADDFSFCGYYFLPLPFIFAPCCHLICRHASMMPFIFYAADLLFLMLTAHAFHVISCRLIAHAFICSPLSPACLSRVDYFISLISLDDDAASA